MSDTLRPSLKDDPEVIAMIAIAILEERRGCAALARQEAQDQRDVALRLEAQRVIISTNVITARREIAAAAERIARAIERSGDYLPLSNRERL